MKSRVAIIIALIIHLQTFGGEKVIRFETLKKENPNFAASYFYTLGIRSMIMSDYNTATLQFKEVLAIRPNHHAAFYQLGQLSNAHGNQKLSLDYAKQAYQLNPENKDYLSFYIEALLKNSELEKAKEILASLHQKGQIDQRSSYFAILISANLGEIEELPAMAKTYIETWGSNPTIIEILTQTLLKEKRYVELEEALDHYITLYPSDVDLILNLAKLKAALYKKEEALILYNRAIELYPNDVDCHLALSEFFRINNDIPKFLGSLIPLYSGNMLEPEAKAGYFKQTILNLDIVKNNYPTVEQLALRMYSSDPTNDAIESAYIDFLLFVGNLDVLNTVLQKRIEEGRGGIENYTTLIEIASYQKNYDKALKYLELGSKTFPQTHQFSYLTSIIHYQREEYSEALLELKKTFRLAKNDSLRSMVLAFKGDIHHQIGEIKKSYTSYKQALKYNPDNTVVLNNYAYFLSVENRNLTQALKMADRANQLEEGNSTYLDTQAWILYKLERYEEARTIQRRAIALDHKETEPTLLLHYGDILYKLGESFLAEIYWEKALKAGSDKLEIENRLKQIK